MLVYISVGKRLLGFSWPKYSILQLEAVYSSDTFAYSCYTVSCHNLEKYNAATHFVLSIFWDESSANCSLNGTVVRVYFLFRRVASYICGTLELTRLEKRIQGKMRKVL
jgi:hypothetical protein